MNTHTTDPPVSRGISLQLKDAQRGVELGLNSSGGGGVELLTQYVLCLVIRHETSLGSSTHDTNYSIDM